MIYAVRLVHRTALQYKYQNRPQFYHNNPTNRGILPRNFFRDISEMSPQVSGGTALCTSYLSLVQLKRAISCKNTTLSYKLMNPYDFCSTFSTACTIFLYILMNNAGFMRNLTKTRMITNNAENSASAESRYPVGTENSFTFSILGQHLS